MKKVLTAFVLIFIGSHVNAQVGIGTEAPSAAAQLDIVAQDRGVLIPRVSLNSPTDATTITGGNQESLLVYNLNAAAQMRPGFYFWHNNRWNRLLSDAESIGSTGSTGESFQETLTTLVYDGSGSLIYTDESGSENVIDLSTLFPKDSAGPAVTAQGEDLEAGDASVLVENGVGAVLSGASISVAEEGIIESKLAPGAVSPQKLSAAAEDAGKVATVQEDGTVSYEAIKAAMPKFFYMPSILIPVQERQVDSQYDSQDRLGRINLHARYQEQFGNPMASSEEAAASIPTLPASELEYHVTYYDDRVFEVEKITADGILHYSVKDAPITEVSFMNIVFVIK